MTASVQTLSVLCKRLDNIKCLRVLQSSSLSQTKAKTPLKHFCLKLFYIGVLACFGEKSTNQTVVKHFSYLELSIFESNLTQTFQPLRSRRAKKWAFSCYLHFSYPKAVVEALSTNKRCGFKNAWDHRMIEQINFETKSLTEIIY